MPVTIYLPIKSTPLPPVATEVQQYPDTVVSQPKTDTKPALVLLLVVGLLSGLILLAVQHGNLFLRELVVASLIILMLLACRQMDQKQL